MAHSCSKRNGTYLVSHYSEVVQRNKAPFHARQSLPTSLVRGMTDSPHFDFHTARQPRVLETGATITGRFASLPHLLGTSQAMTKVHAEYIDWMLWRSRLTVFIPVSHAKRGRHDSLHTILSQLTS